MPLTHRIATPSDHDAINELMALSMKELLPKVLTPEQVARSSDSMGLDSQLVADGTYFLVFEGKTLVGCGGWSRRRTLFGGDSTTGRDDALADPTHEPAKIRAMYTHPDFIRRGIGTLILDLAEDAARGEGFKTIEMGATAPGKLLYEKRGYVLLEDLSTTYSDGTVVPILRMRKPLI
ncbi:MAG: GNAT family N-acetyltransferase [Pseudomonadota bacterium]